MLIQTHSSELTFELKNKNQLGNNFYNESLILAQNQRWRRASDMQVERLKLSSESV